MSLIEIGKYASSDKHAHGYMPYYDRHLDREKINTLVEFGVAEAGSLRMWREWLPDSARVVGFDIKHPDVGTYEGCEVIIQDCTQAQPFAADVIVDDGSHIGAEQLAAFENWWPLLNVGGVYVVEDLETVWHAAYAGTPIVELFHNLMRDTALAETPTSLSPFNYKVAELHMYEQIIFIHKRA